MDTTQETSTPTDATGELIDRLISEGSIGMTQAAKLMGTFRDGKPTVASTVTRWAMHGVRLADGRRLKLESFRLNGRLCTSKQAVLRFIRNQNQQSEAAPQPDATPSTPPRQPTSETLNKAAKQATADCDRIFGPRVGQ